MGKTKLKRAFGVQSGIIDPRQIKSVGRRNRSAGGAVTLAKRRRDVSGRPPALAHERERTDH